MPSGARTVVTDAPDEKRIPTLIVRPDGGGRSDEKRYLMPTHAHLMVSDGDEVHAGDVLTTETKPGKTWERESKRAGKLTFRERVTEYRNQKGELVITARGVGVTTERPVDQG